METRVEKKRGCGYRKEGGLYLVGSGHAEPCGRLPILLDCPPCIRCGWKGPRPSRSYQWVPSKYFLNHADECTATKRRCRSCPLSAEDLGDVLWLSIGACYYPGPADFLAEAKTRGISRRVPRVPKGFKRRSWVWLAHSRVRPVLADNGEQAIDDQGRPRWYAGVFYVFRATAIEYIVRETDTETLLAAKVKAGLTPVRVIRDVDHRPLFDGIPARIEE